jgi:hypothetical protein
VKGGEEEEEEEEEREGKRGKRGKDDKFLGHVTNWMFLFSIRP